MESGIERPTSDREEATIVRRVTWVGLIVNLFLSTFKLVAGLLGCSQAVFADGIHSLSDLVTDVAVIVGSYFWSRRPDASHPYGHRRIETLITISVGLLLALAGLGLGWRAVASFRNSHSEPPGRIAFWAALVSIVCKELLYRWTYRKGKALGSASLRANAWHHRSDAFSSIPAALAVTGAIVIPQWQVLDHVGAIVVAVFIFHAAYRIIRPSARELLEGGADVGVSDEIIGIAESVAGVDNIHSLRSRYVGSRLHVDLHATVDGTMNVKASHDIATEISRKIVREVPGVFDVVVHIEPRP